MESKFLSDGRKVAIIGQLNNQETIVQEVFVTSSGDEIPSGERFVVKSLHDEPVKSFKDKDIENKERQLAKLKNEIDAYTREHRATYAKLNGLKTLLKSSTTAVNNFIDGEGLDTLMAALSGSIKYLVKESYRIEKPMAFDDALIVYDNHYGNKRFDWLNLLSVAGNSNGDLSYRLSRYGDGSGGSVEIYPFESYEDALEHIKKKAIELIESDKISDDSYKACIDMGLRFDKPHVEKAKNHILSNANESFESMNKRREEDHKKACDKLAETTALFEIHE